MKKKRLITYKYLLLLMSLVLILSGCGRTSTEKGTASDTEPLTITEETEKPVEKQYADEVSVLDAGMHIYDITELLPKIEGKEYSDMIAEGDDSILLLYEDVYTETPESSAGATYSVYRLNLTDGKTEAVYENVPIISHREEIVHYCIFVQADPVVILNMLDDSLGFPEEREFLHPELGEDVFIAQNFISGGELYISDTASGIHRVVKNGGTHDLQKVWTAPKGFTGYALEEVTDKGALLRGSSVVEDDSGHVYVRVDLSAGKIVESYRTGEDDTDYQQVVNEGFDFRVNFDRYQELSVIQQGMEYTCAFTGVDPVSRAIREGRATISVSRLPVHDDRLFFRAVWSDEENQEDRILLWDYSGQKSKAFSGPECTAYELPEISAAANKKKEEAVEKEFGIEIYAGNEAELKYVGYEAEADDDVTDIARALYQIERVYANYPKGFFTQLSWDGSPIRIHLVKSIRGTSGESLGSAAGLQWEDAGYVYMALNIGFAGLDQNTIYHETTHAVYNKLMADGFLSEFTDQWMKLNPPGFEYAMTYREQDLPDGTYTADYFVEGDDPEEVYFVNAYDKTYQTEDVADMFASLMDGRKIPEYYASSHLQAKCRFFFERIRAGFDTNGWPEKTAWEKRLEEISR